MCEGHKYLETKKEGGIPAKPRGKSLWVLAAVPMNNESADELATDELAVALFERQAPPAKALPESIKAADPVQSLASEVSVAAKAAVKAEVTAAKAVDATDPIFKVNGLLAGAVTVEIGYAGKDKKEERRKWQEQVTISLAKCLGVKLVKFNMEDKSSRTKALRAVRHAILTRCGKESERNMPEFLRNPA